MKTESSKYVIGIGDSLEIIEFLDDTPGYEKFRFEAKNNLTDFGPGNLLLARKTYLHDEKDHVTFLKEIVREVL